MSKFVVISASPDYAGAIEAVAVRDDLTEAEAIAATLDSDDGQLLNVFFVLECKED